MSTSGRADVSTGTRRRRRAGLPAPLTPLVGREREAAAVGQHLRRTDVRLLTLTGPPGIGKTRLALAVAGAAGANFPDGVAFAPLATITDHALVPAAVARALGLREDRRRPLRDSLLGYCRAEALLLVLDNFEQVLGAGRFVADLLAGCPRVKALVTSRAALRLAGEHQWPVPPLAFADPRAEADPAALAGSAAATLFLCRARAVRPDLAAPDESAPVVAEICARLDGLPLALELAAARVKVLPLPALNAHLAARRLALLTGGARDAPARHRTLRGAIAWSHDLLAPDEQALFRRLGVFVGGCTAEAAQAVCADGGSGVTGGRGATGGVHRPPRGPWRHALDGLASLVDQSLLQPAGAAGGAPRFAMLETLREYALERLVRSGEAAATRRRHAAFCLALAEQAAPALRGPEQVTWLARLEAEHDNLRAALRWKVERARAGDAAAAAQGRRLGAALWPFWLLRGHLGEGRAWLAALLALPGPPVGPPARPRAGLLLGAEQLAPPTADAAAARRLVASLEESLALCRAAGDGSGAARALLALSGRTLGLGDPAAALASAQESLALCRAADDRWGTARALGQVGARLAARGDRAAGRARCEEGLALMRRVGDRHGLARALGGVADILQAQGDYAAARPLLEESAARLRELGHRADLALVLTRLAVLAVVRGDPAARRALVAQSLAAARELGDPFTLAEALLRLGHSARGAGDYAAARRFAEESLALCAELGDEAGRAHCWGLLGSVARHEGQPARARTLLERSLAAARRLEAGQRERSGLVFGHGLFWLGFWCHWNLGDLACDAGGYAVAGARYREALAAGGTLVRAAAWHATTPLVGVARLAAAAGRLERAARLFAAANAIRTSSRRPWSPVDLPDHERVAAALRAARSPAPAALQAAAAEGQTLTVDQAVADALEMLDALAGPTPPAAWAPPAAAAGARAAGAGAPPRLTAREREVAGLVALGQSNRQIAEALVITERTAENHVGHILAKLDFRSRAQIAAWATVHDLA